MTGQAAASANLRQAGGAHRASPRLTTLGPKVNRGAALGVLIATDVQVVTVNTQAGFLHGGDYNIDSAIHSA